MSHEVRLRVSYTVVAKGIDADGYDEAAQRAHQRVGDWFQERHSLRSPPDPFEPSDLRIKSYQVTQCKTD